MATDLDGTLVHSDGTVTSRTREVLEELDRRGVPVVFVTGRPLRWAIEVFEHVGRHGLAIVSNGALVWNVPDGAVHLERLLQPALGIEVSRLIREAVPGSAFAVEDLDGIGLEPEFLERYPVPEGSRRAPVDELFDRPAFKLLARHEEVAPQAFWDAAEAVVGERAVITWSSASALLEISAAGVTKASTLSLVCARAGGRGRRGRRVRRHAQRPRRCSGGRARRTRWPTRTRRCWRRPTTVRPGQRRGRRGRGAGRVFGL